MTFNALNRKVHYWASIIVALPFLVVIATGLLLQLKKQIAWIQPTEQRGGGTEPALALADILVITRRVDEAQVRSWREVKRIDVRPDKGLVKVTSASDWEVQIDAATGAVLHSAHRRSDLIEVAARRVVLRTGREIRRLPPGGHRDVRDVAHRDLFVRPALFGQAPPGGKGQSVAAGRVANRLNQCRRYAWVRRKFDGLLLVPCHSSLNRTIAVGTFRSLSPL